MTLPLIILIALGVLGLIIVLWLIGVYNALINLRNFFKNAYAQIDVQLKRRYDLIPNLVEVAKGYLAHERETLEAVIAARSRAVSANVKVAADPTNAAAMTQLGAAEGGLTAALGRLFALSEAYPDLKANTTMQQLSEELTSTENKVAFARQAFNDAVMRYNTHREIFPNNIIAGIFNFTEAKLFEIENETERQAPKVSFS
jgi:LemA protein